MAFTQVLAVLPVRDLDKAADWYARLLGRAEDARPMESLADFHVTDGGWLQVFVAPERAGRGEVNLAVDDLEAARARLEEHGFDVSGEWAASGGVRVLPLTDPDGNTVTVLGNVRPA